MVVEWDCRICNLLCSFSEAKVLAVDPPSSSIFDVDFSEVKVLSMDLPSSSLGSTGN